MVIDVRSGDGSLPGAPAGQPAGAVVVKRAEGPDEAARLRREAEVLAAGAHPGVVSLVGFDDDDGGSSPVLRTARVEGPSLASLEPALDLEEAAGVVAALTSTLADLHDLGLVHGAVAPEHVLLDGGSRPVLCGLGYGGVAGRPAVGLPALDPPFADVMRAEGQGLDPSTDVFGAGAILRWLVGGRAAGDAVLRLSDKATAPLPVSRITARELADGLYAAVPEARLPARLQPDLGPGPGRGIDAAHRQRPLEQWRRAQTSTRARVARPADPGRGLPPEPGRRRLRLVGAGMAALIVCVTAGLLVSGGRSSAPRAAPPESVPGHSDVEPEPPTTGAASTRPASRVAPRAGCPAVSGVLAADVDGDGCAEALRWSDGVVEGGGSRWQVGQAGDVVAVGDWLCSGRRSLAVLRPATGEVYRFDGWTGPGGQLHAPLVGKVDGGRALRAADLDGDGCHELMVDTGAGTPAVLRASRGPGP